MYDAPAHRRVNDILLGPLERPALQWLAAHAPAWVTPDMLTGTGLFASVLIFFSYIATNLDKGFLWLASLGFVLQWLGDSLDGTLARYRKIERPRYGFFVDHIVDAISECLIFFGFGLSPYVRFDLALIALIGYMLMANLIFINTYVNGVFRLSYSKLGPTEVRVIAILANTIVFFLGNPVLSLPFGLGQFSFYNLVVIVASVVLFTVFLVVSVSQAMELNRQDQHALWRVKQPKTRKKGLFARVRLSRSRPAAQRRERRSEQAERGLPAD
ncbi:MAG TPA: CDP-alcohol phosphatidyltransferase family protein [Anaerolineaceae bacterium]|nr:CDP-alcohol phosphatidyltransferase family protein [Anaerolineaceae bacterium]